MRERAFVYVAGPPGCGKTMFVESMLRGAGRFLFVARCTMDHACPHPQETAPQKHPELQRYRDAGATDAVVFTFSEKDIDSDAFFMTHMMAEYSEGVILEGDNPFEYVDLSVFVAPAPSAGETLFVRRRRNRAREQRAMADAIERLIRKPDGIAQLLAAAAGDPIADFARKSPEVMEETRARLLADLMAARKAPVPEPTWHWRISGSYSGIEHAQLVVVNVRDDGERQAAEKLAADVVRLRKEDQLFNDILGFRGRRTPITAVVANLAQPEDPGRKKAIARARRAFQSRT